MVQGSRLFPTHKERGHRERAAGFDGAKSLGSFSVPLRRWTEKPTSFAFGFLSFSNRFVTFALPPSNTVKGTLFVSNSYILGGFLPSYAIKETFSQASLRWLLCRGDRTCQKHVAHSQTPPFSAPTAKRGGREVSYQPHWVMPPLPFRASDKSTPQAVTHALTHTHTHTHC